MDLCYIIILFLLTVDILYWPMTMGQILCVPFLLNFDIFSLTNDSLTDITHFNFLVLQHFNLTNNYCPGCTCVTPPR